MLTKRHLFALCATVSIFIGAIVASFMLWPTKAPEIALGMVDTSATTPVINSDQFPMIYVWLLLAVSSASTLCSVLVAIYVIQWRKVEASGSVSVVPSILLSDFENVKKHFGSMTASIGQNTRTIEKYIAQSSEQQSILIESLNIFRTDLTRKEELIEDFKLGYEAKIHKRFANRFLKVRKNFIEELEANKGSEAIPVKVMYDLVDLYDNALEEIGITQFLPQVGADYRTEFGVADSPRLVKTSDRDQHQKIASIESPGFAIETQMGLQCLTPAVVSVYHYQG